MRVEWTVLEAVRTAEDDRQLEVLTDDELVNLARFLQVIDHMLGQFQSEYGSRSAEKLGEIRDKFPAQVPLGLQRGSADEPPCPDQVRRAQGRVGAALSNVTRHILMRIAQDAFASVHRDSGSQLRELLSDTATQSDEGRRDGHADPERG